MKKFIYAGFIACTIGSLFIGCSKDDEPAANKPPTCVITSPADGAAFTLADDINISVTADDTDGNITEVRLYVDDEGYYSATTFPYKFTIPKGTLSGGTHTIKAVAKDDKNATAESSISIITAYPEENPLAAYLAATGFDEYVESNTYASYYEEGFGFIPKVTGQINAVTVKIPANATNIRVTIWETATKSVLKTITIPSVTKDVEVKQYLDNPLALTKDKGYTITFNTKSDYTRSRTGGGVPVYPIIAGNISIEGFGYYFAGGTAQTYPDHQVDDEYYGDCSFVFQQMP
ncbi:MAG: hypothetical protein LBE36_08525 [Flavobacteriaceae bacterium]|jgi:hypothetical protein|nr:hypothetical protein [Flavobacteriaceae bacterium]